MTSEPRYTKKTTAAPTPVEAKTVTALDRARELMPKIEKAKAKLGAGE